MSREKGSRRIIVVDDESAITRAIKLGLRSHGFEVDEYNDPVKAVSEFKPGAYGLAILDINMPGMNGFHVYRELKKADEDIAICFLTAFDVYEKEFKKVFPEVMVQAFLRKPITLTALAREVNRLLAEKEPARLAATATIGVDSGERAGK